MEFKYRAGEDPSYSLDPYFTTIQSIRGGILGGEVRRPDALRGPMMSAREALRRELEKDRIREEILAREILRRRELEEEVRREMAFEREIALRRQADRYSLAPSSVGLPMRASPQLLELRGGERAAPVSPRNIDGIVDDVTAPDNGSITRISEVKDEADGSLGKSSTNNITGTKRKALCVEDLLQLASPKKAHKSWTCSLCEVSTTSEKGMQEHIEGKKHKAKEKQQQAKAVEIRKKAKFTFKCEHCRIKCNSEPMMVAHLKGKKHAVRVQELLRGDDGVPEIKASMKDGKSEDTAANAENVEQGNIVAAETTEVVIGEGTEATEAQVIKEAEAVKGKEEEMKEVIKEAEAVKGKEEEVKEVVIGGETEATEAQVIKEAEVVKRKEEEMTLGEAAMQDDVEETVVAAEKTKVVIGEGTGKTEAPDIKEAEVVKGEEVEAKMSAVAIQDDVEGTEVLVDEESKEE